MPQATIHAAQQQFTPAKPAIHCAASCDPQRMEALGWGAEQMPNGSGRSYITIRFTFFEDLSKITAVRIDDTLIPLRKTD